MSKKQKYFHCSGQVKFSRESKRNQGSKKGDCQILEPKFKSRVCHSSCTEHSKVEYFANKQSENVLRDIKPQTLFIYLDLDLFPCLFHFPSCYFPQGSVLLCHSSGPLSLNQFISF